MDPVNEDEFINLIQEQASGVDLKYIKNLGCFLVCDDESTAEEWFQYLNKSWMVYSMSRMPKDLKLDPLRSEYCFMEGVRPNKTTSVAERLIKRHLGFL